MSSHPKSSSGHPCLAPGKKPHTGTCQSEKGGQEEGPGRQGGQREPEGEGGAEGAFPPPPLRRPATASARTFRSMT